MVRRSLKATEVKFHDNLSKVVRIAGKAGLTKDLYTAENLSCSTQQLK